MLEGTHIIKKLTGRTLQPPAMVRCGQETHIAVSPFSLDKVTGPSACLPGSLPVIASAPEHGILNNAAASQQQTTESKPWALQQQTGRQRSPALTGAPQTPAPASMPLPHRHLFLETG